MAVDMFLNLDGVKGESQDKVHTKEIDVLAWSWGMANSGTAHVGGGAGSGKVSVQDLSFTKYVDSSSPNLMLNCCNGKHFKTRCSPCANAEGRQSNTSRSRWKQCASRTLRPGAQEPRTG